MAEKAPVPNLELRPGEEPSLQKLAELFRGIQQNFDALYSMFPLLGGSLAGVLKLATLANRKIAFGEGSLTWTSSKSAATKEIEHGLGTTPIVVIPGSTNPAITLGVESTSSTKFKMGGYYEQSTLSGTFSFYWLAIG